MPCIPYITKNFSRKSQIIIDQANSIIEEYQAQGYSLTLRQLYYQFVSRDLLANSIREYKRLGNIINDARLAGEVDWRAIEDRTRNLQSIGHWENPREIVETCARAFNMDKWENQDTRIEVWIEKDALVGVIEGVCKELDVPYFSCRGYTSQSEMWEASQRLGGHADRGQQPIIIHLGDHDPSGIDMTRDIKDRLDLFLGYETEARVQVDRIALNMDQVRKHKPPPNPAKLTDSRIEGYMKKFGTKSWELDALEPSILESLIEKQILLYRDEDKYQEILVQEAEHKQTLDMIVDDL